MKKLSCETQARAKAFIVRHARPLEQRIYAYEFEQGPKDAIFEALAAFQNPDGGFGNALEPDLRLPDSSVLATTVGLQVLREFDAPAEHPLVRGEALYTAFDYELDPKLKLAEPFLLPFTIETPSEPGQCQMHIIAFPIPWHPRFNADGEWMAFNLASFSRRIPVSAIKQRQGR